MEINQNNKPVTVTFSDGTERNGHWLIILIDFVQ